jgi:hypothetical protein
MYFSDNDITPGAPTPEETRWLRPEQILTELIETGED